MQIVEEYQFADKKLTAESRYNLAEDKFLASFLTTHTHTHTHTYIYIY